jgi:hypothetical protein
MHDEDCAEIFSPTECRLSYRTRSIPLCNRVRHPYKHYKVNFVVILAIKLSLFGKHPTIVAQFTIVYFTSTYRILHFAIDKKRLPGVIGNETSQAIIRKEAIREINFLTFFSKHVRTVKALLGLIYRHHNFCSSERKINHKSSMIFYKNGK